MPKKPPSKLQRLRRRMLTPSQLARKLVLWIKRYWHKGPLQKLGVITSAAALVLLVCMYAIAQWFIFTQRSKPLEIGVTFVPNYAKFYGQDPKEVFTAMVDDMGFKRVRLVSYWSDIEKKRGTYDFRELDWQMKMAEERGLDVSLSLGLRQPRWPECHMPGWARDLPKEQWYPKLLNFTEATVNRYKDSPALKSYQLENEFLLDVFGKCPDHDRERLIDEFRFVKSLDSSRPLIVNRSNNAVPSWPVNEPKADKVGAAVYKRVWDKTVTKRYFEYPLPAWYYAFLAGGTKLTTGKDTFIHELQTEPWLPDGFDMRTASTEELYQTFNPDLLPSRIQYAVNTGMREIDVWGVEWWYYMKEVRGEPELWQVGKETLQKYR